MREIFKKCIVILLTVMCFSCFFACEKTRDITGPIPDGIYEYDLDGKTYVYFESTQYCDYWKIEGDEAVFYFDNWLDYRAKIVEKDGEIYFEGYKWNDFFNNLGALLCGKKLKKLVIPISI